MKICIASLESAAEYSQSKKHLEPKLNKEQPDDYERRTWREKCHAEPDGQIFIPGAAFKFALDSAAKFLGEKVPGKRNATFTKHFLAGVLVFDNAPIGWMKADVPSIELFVNSDGVRGSGKRVYRIFPQIPTWKADVAFHITDDTIDRDTFERVLAEAGKFIGIGRYRPQVGGFNGRWHVREVVWN